MSNIFPKHQFDRAEINNLASLVSSSMLIIPGALLGFLSGTIVFLPISTVTGLTVLGGIFSYFFAHDFIRNEIPQEGSEEDKNEKEALISIATSFRIFIWAILGLSFGEIFLFKFIPGIWPNFEALAGLLAGISSPFVMDYFLPPDDISYNYCVKLSVAFEIMLYTGLVSFCLLESFPGWLSFYGWGAGLGLGFLGGLAIGALISSSMSEGNNDMFAKQSLLNVTLPSIIIGLASGFVANLLFEVSSIYFTLGVGFFVTSLLMIGTYQIVKYFDNCNDSYSKDIVHNILILTATFFSYTFAGSLLSAGIYSFFNLYTDGLLLAITEGYIAGAVISFLHFGSRMYNSLTKSFEENKEELVNKPEISIEDSNDGSENKELTTFSYDKNQKDNDASNKEESFFPRFLSTSLIVSELTSILTVFITMVSAGYFTQDNNFANNISC